MADLTDWIPTDVTDRTYYKCPECGTIVALTTEDWYRGFIVAVNTDGKSLCDACTRRPFLEDVRASEHG